MNLTSIYRGLVIDDNDPMGKGRLYINVPANPGTTGWALPCVAYDSSDSVSTPPIGENVWIMFEDGDPSYPIWLGWFPG